MERIKLFCQPAYDYDSHKVTYIEILIRGYGKHNGVYDIFRYIDNTKNEASFDLDILTETLNILNNYGKIDTPVGVNLCASTIEQAGISKRIIDIIEENNKFGNDIIIEINEATDFAHKNVANNIKYLKEHNIRIAIDDFGLQHANLIVLLMYHIDILKIDKKFVDEVDEEVEESQSAILRALNKIIEELKIKHIVEGIETDKQLDNIKKLGYTTVQGYIYQKPMEFNKFISDSIKKDNIKIVNEETV